MEIQIENQQRKILLNPAPLKTIIKTLLKREGVDDAVLSFVFVTSQKMRAYNQKYKNRNYTTDVLAFDWTEDYPVNSEDSKSSRFLAGDIIISTDAVIQNVKRFKKDLDYELVLYVVHGLLHIIGYDDHSPEDVKKMRAREEALMDLLGRKIQKVIAI